MVKDKGKQGGRKQWKQIGDCRYSDMAAFSFHPAKAIATGEGGAVTTNRKDLYEKLIMLRNHGITKESSKFKVKKSKLVGGWYHEMQCLGYNYWITDFQAALGLSQLTKVKKFIKKRRQIVQMYNSALSKIDGLKLPVEKKGVESAWHLYCIRFKTAEKRKKAFDFLKGKGIGVQVHYIPVHLHPYYRETFGYKEGYYPNAEDYYRQALSIPIYPKLKTAEIQYVIKILRQVFI